MRKNIIIIIAILAILVIGRMMITQASKSASAKQRIASSVPSVTVEEVKTENVRREFTATPRIMAK